MGFISSDRLMTSGAVKTSSALRKFWLTKVRGYKVENALRHPKKLSMGQLIYTTTWVLRPGGSA